MRSSIQARLRNFFRIYEGEAAKILLFALLGALLQCGIAVGVTAGDALFLNNLGASHLPFVYLIFPLTIIAYIVSHTLLIGRLGIERVLDLTLVGLAILIISLSIILNVDFGGSGSSIFVFYIAKIATMVAYVAVYTLFWNVADSYFTILDAKRVFAFLSAGCALGAAAGGALVHSLSTLMPVEQMFLVWAALALISLPVAVRIRRTWKKLDSEHFTAGESSLGAEIRNLSKTYRRSKFAICITASLFLTLTVCLICEYQYYGILAADKSASELASLLGRLGCAVSLFNLFVNLFLFNRLVELAGVRNLALLQPLALIAVFCLLVVEHTEAAAILGYFVYHGLFICIDGNNFNLILNALPDRERKQLRTFIEGACEPLAHAFVGGGLVLVAVALSPAQVSVIGLTLAVLALILGLLLRGSYVSAMVENLRSRWLDFSVAHSAHSYSTHARALTSDQIAPLLSLAPECTPSERRLLEIRISALGSRAVPGCVRALEEEQLPLKSRSLAARILTRISFPQLESMSNQLVNQTLRLAYDTFIWERDLRGLNLTDETRLLALQAARDRREALIEFLLEILTLSGRLASFEPLAASLRSNDMKSRGTAIETVEQACSRELRRLLRPLLDEREHEKRLPLALSLTGAALSSPLERLESAAESDDQLGSALALELLWQLDRQRAESKARLRIESSRDGLSHFMASAILSRAAGKQEATTLDKAAKLLDLPFASRLPVTTLLALSEASIEGADSGDILARFDFNSLIAQSRRDPILALSLFKIIRGTTDAHKAIA